MNTIKKQLPKLLVILGGILFAAVPALATSTLITQQGGTGTTTPSGILYGDNGATSHVNTVSIGTGLSFSGGTLSNTGATFAYPFTPQSWGNATTSVLGMGGLISTASSTFSFLTSGLVGNNQGSLYSFATSTLPFLSNALTKGYFIVGGDSGIAQATSTIFISSVGNVGIGSTTPGTLLSIGGNGTGINFVDGTTATSTISGHLHINGNLQVDGQFFAPVTLVGGNTTINGSLTVTGATTLATLTGILMGNSGNIYATATSSPINLNISGNAATATTLTGALSNTLGGTGQNSSAWTGLAGVNSGTWYQLATSTISLGSTLATITNASTTALTASNYFEMPHDITAPTISGACEIDTTDGQLKCGSNGTTSVFDPRRFYSFGMSTTTAWTGTTTLTLAPFPVAGTLKNVACTTDVGTLGVDLYYGPTPTHLAYIPTASTTANTFTWTANNTPGVNASSTVAIGTPASSPTKISCTATYTITGT